MRAVTINEEALRSSRLSSDLDSFRRRYRTIEKTDKENIYIQFVAPKIICFEEYRFVLLQKSRTEILESKYYYRPDYLSYDEYSTTNLWNLLMFINEIPTIEEFNRDTILIPSRSAILNITKDVVKRDPVRDLVLMDEIPSIETEKLFYYFDSLPTLIAPVNQTSKFKSIDLYFYKEVFTIDVISARQRYVDLQFNPIPESLSIKVDNSPTYIYGKHYMVIKNNGKINRLTWDPRKILNGVGLVDVLSEGTEFEVQYSKKI